MGASPADLLEINMPLGNKLYPATVCGRCRKSWGTDQRIVHPNGRKEMQLNWHCYCARGFKESEENCWAVSALQGQRHSWLLEEFISGPAASHSVH